MARTARERSQSTTEARLANGGLKDAAGGPPVPVEMLLSDDGAAGTGSPDIADSIALGSAIGAAA